MGDAINMAARLMCHKEAKNAILCDQKTYNLCQGEFQFDNIGEIMVKGKAHPISVFRPVFSIAGGESSTTNLRAGNAKNLFLGRERERHLFNVVLSQMKISPTVNNFLVSAEGGLGLTTFANHCRTKAVKTGCYLW